MENVNFNHLYYFHIVAEQGSVTGAAKVANVTKPTISAQLRQLEEFLGAELFDRRGGRMRLNEAGRLALRHTEVMFESARTLMRQFRRDAADPPETLRVGVSTEVARALAAEFFEPLIELDGVMLKIQHGDASDLREALLSLEIDLLLVDAAPAEHLELGLAARLLQRSPLVAVGRADGGDGDLAALLDKRSLLHHWRHSHLHWQIEEWLRGQNARPRVDAHIDDVPTMIAMAARGNAIAFVPRAAVGPHVARGEVRVLAELDGLESDVHALYVQRDVPRLVETAVDRLCRMEAEARVNVGGLAIEAEE